MAKDLSWTKMQVETIDFFHGIWGVPVKFALKPKHLGAAPWARFPHPCPCQEDNEPREKGKGGGKGKNRGGKGGPKGKDVAWPARWGSMSAIPTARS